MGSSLSLSTLSLQPSGGSSGVSTIIGTSGQITAVVGPPGTVTLGFANPTIFTNPVHFDGGVELNSEMNVNPPNGAINLP